MTIRYFYAMRAHSEIERAHILDPDSPSSGAVSTRCGLEYTVDAGHATERPDDELPDLVCRNCRRSLRGDE